MTTNQTILLIYQKLNFWVHHIWMISDMWNMLIGDNNWKTPLTTMKWNLRNRANLFSSLLWSSALRWNKFLLPAPVLKATSLCLSILLIGKTSTDIMQIMLRRRTDSKNYQKSTDKSTKTSPKTTRLSISIFWLFRTWNTNWKSANQVNKYLRLWSICNSLILWEIKLSLKTMFILSKETLKNISSTWREKLIKCT